MKTSHCVGLTCCDFVMQTQKVFVQYKYCALCQLNHKKGKKHVLSKRHQEIVTNVLKKFLKKILTAKESLEKPSVKEMGWSESERMFWCYFCQMDITRHRHNQTANGECMIEHGGMLEHIRREDHIEKTVEFLKGNRQDLKRTPEFVLSSDVYIKYLENIEKACSQFFMLKAQALNRMASDIRTESALRQRVVNTALMEQSLLEQGKNQSQQFSLKSQGASGRPSPISVREEDVRGKRTIQAFGEGLTAIDRSHEDDSVGNIFTNAPPPWMLPDPDDDAASAVIGPTMEDLEKHRKQEKKRQLPAGRVGAKFDHKTDQEATWLPNFGGVWRQGRRTDSGKKFYHRQQRKFKNSFDFVPPSSSSSSSSLSSFAARSALSSQTELMSTSLQAEFFSLPKPPQATAAISSRNQELLTVSCLAGNLQLEPSPIDVSASITPFPSRHRNTSHGKSFTDIRTVPWSATYSEDTNVMTNFSDTLRRTDDGNLIQIRPYMRKRKSTSSTDTQGSSFASVSHSSPDVLLTGTLGKYIERGAVNPYVSKRAQTHPSLTAVAQDRPISTLMMNGPRQASSSFVMGHQSQQNHGNVAMFPTPQPPVRLISTPVLKQRKKL